MSHLSSPLEALFSDTSQSWDLDRLHAALAKCKQAPLSPTERVCLRGLLSGVNPTEIAAALHRQPQGLRVDLTRGLYRHIEALTLEKVKNWREVAACLEKAGYRRSPPSPAKRSAQFNWGEAPDVPVFFGRSQELAQLQQWTVDDRCRLITLLGMGGMGKTNLSLKLAQATQEQFEVVIWRSLLNAPPIAELLTDLLQVLSGQPEASPVDPNAAISRLLQHLKQRRCLLVLDNVETILQGGALIGQYRQGFEGYGQLFQQLGAVSHQSCLLLTSREKPREIAQLEGKTRPVRSLELGGLGIAEGKQIFAEIGTFSATEPEWQQLIEFYHGNPLVLELVAKHIDDVFNGEIAAFLQEGTPLFHDLNHLLDWHFDRLSEPEQEIMVWLAIDREPVAIAELKADILSSTAKAQVSATLQSLQRRFPLERKGDRFTQQPVVMEYMTNRLIKEICTEIVSQRIQSFNQYALIKAQAKDYVREIQIRIFVEPILAALQGHFCTKTAIVEQLQQVLAHLRKEFTNIPGYGGGNLINLLCQLQVDLAEYDFSHLTLWQAYLADTQLHRVNLAGANLAKSVFAETFGGISCVAFSPDGQYLATSDTSGKVQVWQSVTGQQQIALQADSVWTWAVAFSPDGQLLATAGDDYQVKLWDAQTGECLQILAGHTNTVNAIAFQPRANAFPGNLLASCGQDATIRLWSLGEQGAVCVGILQGHEGRVWSIAFSPDGQTIVSGSEDCTLKLWDVRTGANLKTWSGHAHWIKSVAFSADGRAIASGSFDGTLKLWDTATSECLHTWQAHQGCVTSVAFRPVTAGELAPLLASSSYDHTIKLWDTAGTCLRTWQAHSNRVWCVAFSPSAQLLASGGEDHATRLWDIQTGQSTKTWKGHTNGILSLSLSSTQSYLATGHEDQTVKLWHFQTGEILKTLRGHTNRVWSVAFAPSSMAHASSEILASGSADRTIKLWNSQTGDCLRTLQGHKGWVWSVVFNPTGNWLASGSYDQTIRLWETRTGECLTILTGHKAPVVNVAFSPDGRLLASSSLDTTVKLWDLPTGRCLQTLQGHRHSVWAIAFSPDGQRLASCSYDKTVKLWDIASGHCDRTFEGHTSPVVCLAFSPDGQQIASGSFDRTLRLWDICSGQLLQTFCGHTKPVYALLFKAISLPFNPLVSLEPSNTLLSSSFDETIRFWDIKTGRCLNTWREYRPYEEMNITNIIGLTEAQKATLCALGAIET